MSKKNDEEKRKHFLNFADYFANALRHKEISYTMPKNDDLTVTLYLNLYYDMGSYNSIGNMKVNRMISSFL